MSLYLKNLFIDYENSILRDDQTTKVLLENMFGNLIREFQEERERMEEVIDFLKKHAADRETKMRCFSRRIGNLRDEMNGKRLLIHLRKAIDKYPNDMRQIEYLISKFELPLERKERTLKDILNIWDTIVEDHDNLDILNSPFKK